jgi:hypothetical protein
VTPGQHGARTSNPHSLPTVYDAPACHLVYYPLPISLKDPLVQFWPKAAAAANPVYSHLTAKVFLVTTLS